MSSTPTIADARNDADLPAKDFHQLKRTVPGGKRPRQGGKESALQGVNGGAGSGQPFNR